MPDPLVLEPRRTALLVMDYQVQIVENFAGTPAVLEAARSTLAAARSAGLLIVYVVVGFRPGFPEVSPNNASFSAIRQSNRFDPSSPGVAIHPAVAPGASEVVVTKHRVGAFLGTDMDMILRANGIDTLLLLGIATSGVVLSTVRHAADADYRLIVVQDACADRDPDVHRVLVEKVFPRQASVVDSSEVIAVLGPREARTHAAE